MSFFDINYDTDKNVNVSFKTDDTFTKLYCKVVGQIEYGSKGNNSADYLFGKVCQYLFQVNPMIFILDLRELNYEWVID